MRIQSLNQRDDVKKDAGSATVELSGLELIALNNILSKVAKEAERRSEMLLKMTRVVHTAEFRGQTAHIVINYRGRVNRTFAIPASAVLEYMNTQTRKSIPWQWAALNGIEVEQHLLRVHWRYDVDGLLRVLEGGRCE